MALPNENFRSPVVYVYGFNVTLLAFLMLFTSIAQTVCRLVSWKFDYPEDEKLATKIKEAAKAKEIPEKAKAILNRIFDPDRLKRVMQDHVETIPFTIAIWTVYVVIVQASTPAALDVQYENYRNSNAGIAGVLFSLFTIIRICYTIIAWIGVPILRTVLFYIGWAINFLTVCWMFIILWMDTFQPQ